jgi:hypothetical protein
VAGAGDGQEFRQALDDAHDGCLQQQYEVQIRAPRLKDAA